QEPNTIWKCPRWVSFGQREDRVRIRRPYTGLPQFKISANLKKAYTSRQLDNGGFEKRQQELEFWIKRDD
ncbi:MAG: hypothetical protein ACUVXA_20675, partial [Candidatus Jordarchaeum sp.]|uniref:hypothetical protein n=1 Tax=Candidatus Jordarchaeum sp. TaxID=2823881 RepID=UPI004049A954